MTAVNLDRYLTIRILYPKPERRDDVLDAVRKVADAARAFDGLVEIGAWLDEENSRLISISLWDSRELAMKATAAMHPLFADVPWSDWERRPAESFLGLSRVV